MDTSYSVVVKMDENDSMDIDAENLCSLGGKDCSQYLRSNFGSVTGNNGFNRTTPSLDQCKPGAVKKLVIKNLKGEVPRSVYHSFHDASVSAGVLVPFHMHDGNCEIVIAISADIVHLVASFPIMHLKRYQN